MIVQGCYWDFGRWSDLWRVWRPLPEPCPGFEDCMKAARTQDDQLRWARIVCDLVKEVFRRCEKSAWAAHLEIAARLQGLLSLDSSGRQVLPHDVKADLSRAYCMAVAAAPLTNPSQMGDKGLTSREFVRLLVSSARSGIESQQQIAILGLGHINTACQTLVAQEAAALAEDYLERQMQRVMAGCSTCCGCCCRWCTGAVSSRQGPLQEQALPSDPAQGGVCFPACRPGSTYPGWVLASCAIWWLPERSKLIPSQP